MESTGAHRVEEFMAFVDGLRRRRPGKEAKTIRVDSKEAKTTISVLRSWEPGTLKLQLDLSATLIADVKAMIYEKDGITHPIQQELIFDEQRLDDDHRMLADYGVGPYASLFLYKKGSPTPIDVVMPWKPYRLKFKLDLSATLIADVKAMIYEQDGITHPMQQELTFRGERLDDDHRMLADYGVTPYAALLLFRKHYPIDDTGVHRMETMASEGLRRRIQEEKFIIVDDSLGMITKLEADLSETCVGLKAMIYKKEGIHPETYALLFNAQRLHHHRTLGEHGIVNGSIIDLRRHLSGGGGGGGASMSIYVTKLDGQIFTVVLRSPMMFIHEVRDRIRLQEHIPQNQQHLVFCGHPLIDHKTLADYNIQDKSTLHLALSPFGDDRVPPEDKDGLQAADAFAVAVGEGSSHGHGQQSSGSQSWHLMASHYESINEQMEARSETEEPRSMVVNITVSPADQIIRQQQKRWSKYSVKALVFAITMLATYLVGSASTLFSNGNMVFKICIGAFFIADAVLSIMKPPKMGVTLIYLSCFLLLVISYLLLVSSNKYYGYAILPVPLPVVVALLQHKLLYGQTGQQRTNIEGDQNVDNVAPGQAHNNDQDENDFDRIFELSADIVNCGGLITVVFGNSMVGPVSVVGFLFFYTVALGLYLMMVTTVRTVVLTTHARYLAILLKVLLVITLITALIHVRRSNVSSA